MCLGKVEHADALLTDYGQYCFEEGGSLHDYSARWSPGGRGSVVPLPRHGVWRAWRSLVPVQSNRPMPLPVLLATQALALRRCAVRMCAPLGLGFLGLLRPAEVLKLMGKSLVTPRKVMGPPHLMYIDIGASKSSYRSGLLHQPLRMDDSNFVPFVEKMNEQLGPDEKLLPLGA